jgi:hypothetical protein
MYEIASFPLNSILTTTPFANWFLTLTISTCRHFQNGHHNTAKIQHCPISSKFDMWVDNVVPNWFPTLNNFYRSPFSKWPRLKNKLKATFEIEQCWIFAVLWRPFWKWRPVEIFQCQESIRDIIIYHRKISAGLHFQNGHHNTANIQHCSISKVAFDLFFKPVVSGRFGRLETS